MSSFFETSPFSSSSSRGAASSINTRVIPAQVNYLTIYNPSLGDTDETEGEQIVFWASKKELLAAHERVGGRARDTQRASTNTKGDPTGTQKEAAEEKQQIEDTNYRLRQIGLARGMIDFVKNFSNDKPVSSIETQTSRIILHELEQGWWILASIDLTRLPVSAVSHTQTQTSTPKSKKERANNDLGSKKDANASELYEYSAREVASPQLLLAQILKAHGIFLLHHAATLWELYNRSGRARFTAYLQKFWGKFLWDWDVLLHGSPAVDVYGPCMKLAGGGELGIGVGEEEWGSGEREVLEGFVSRTEGCCDLIVGRYGDAPPPRKRTIDDGLAAKREDTIDSEESERNVWLGNGDDPGPADGVIFSGIGTLSRRSLASVSQWMEAIFKHGEDAYGVGESPSAGARQKRKYQRPRPSRKVSDEPRALIQKQVQDDRGQVQDAQDSQPRFRSPKVKAPDLRRKALENSALPPGIPAPLVTSVERSLDEAIAKASQRTSSKSPRSSPTQEKTQEEAMKAQGAGDSNTSGSWFDTDKMTKVFKLGYGTSWTLSPKGFAEQSTEAQSIKSGAEEQDLLLPVETQPQPANTAETRPQIQRTPSKPAEERLQEIDPAPEISDEDEATSKPFLQHLEKSIGRFIIGLSGDLENAEFEDDDGDDNQDDALGLGQDRVAKHQRLFLRTLTIEMDRSLTLQRPSIVSIESSTSQKSAQSQKSVNDDSKAKTSAASSVDGPAQRSTHYEKVQIAVYVHQPFIFVFLFSLHTPNLTLPGFYRGIHHQLGPLQIPLLRRTDPERVAERIREAMLSRSIDTRHTNQGAMSQLEQVAGGTGNTIYDLVYDPVKLTIRTSIPNIPVPTLSSDQLPAKSNTVSGSWYTLGIPIGTSSSIPTQSRSPSQQRGTNIEAAELRARQWARMDALNVHQQILNTYAATHSDFSSLAPTTMASASKSAYSITTAMPAASLLKDTELERTVKTNRGWWVLWMRVSPFANQSSKSTRPSRANSASDQVQISRSMLTNLATHQSDKEAFLVRKSADNSPMKTSVKSGTSSPLAGGGRWLLREQLRDPQRSGSGSTGADGSSATVTAKGVGEGVGIDARKWIDGLLTLTS